MSSLPVGIRGTAGEMLALVRSGRASTRTDLADATGLARSTVSKRVDELIDADLVREAGDGPSTGGRPPVRLAFHARAGLVLAADLGATRARVAVTDLMAHPLAELAEDVDIGDGPEHVLSWVRTACTELLDRLGAASDDVWGIGVGVPGPVDFGAGAVVSPPIMPGWDGYSVRDAFVDTFDAHVLVDNDVNIMAVGEWSAGYREVEHLLFVKIGTGIGSGLIQSGRIQRGAQGSAGDLGHVRVPGNGDELCRCGNFGCLEAVAGGAALAGRLRHLGYDVRTSRDVARLGRAGNRDAARLVRDAGRDIGSVLATAINMLNPAIVVLGGTIAQAHEQLLAGVREVIYQRSLPLATRHLQIVRSRLDDAAGITGAATMAIEHLLDPARVDAFLEARAGQRPARLGVEPS